MISLEQMTARRPYLFRAFYDWLLDNDLTPYIVVNTTVSGVMVPESFIKDNQIVLNIAPQSVGQFSSNNQQIEFNARFGGIPEHIIVPMAALDAIYARENNIGFAFEEEPYYQKEPQLQADNPEPTKISSKKISSNPFHIVE